MWFIFICALCCWTVQAYFSVNCGYEPCAVLCDIRKKTPIEILCVHLTKAKQVDVILVVNCRKIQDKVVFERHLTEFHNTEGKGICLCEALFSELPSVDFIGTCTTDTAQWGLHEWHSCSTMMTGYRKKTIKRQLVQMPPDSLRDTARYGVETIRIDTLSLSLFFSRAHAFCCTKHKISSMLNFKHTQWRWSLVATKEMNLLQEHTNAS